MQDHLVTPIEAFLRREREPAFSGDELRGHMGAIAAYYTKELFKGLDEHKPASTPSTPHSCGKCYLQNWFKWNRFTEEPLGAQVKLNFRLGHVIELELYHLALLAGEECAHYQKGMQKQLGGLDTWHFIDFIHTSKVDGKRRVVDVKSLSSFAFDRVKNFEMGEPLGRMSQPMDDEFGYISQGNRYIKACLSEELIDPPGELIFLGMRKDTGALVEHVIQYDIEKINRADEFSKLIQEHTVLKGCPECKGAGKIQQAEDFPGKILPEGSQRPGPEGEVWIKCEPCRGNGTIPDRWQSERPPRPANLKPEKDKEDDWILPLQCRYCVYKHHCWTKPHQDLEWAFNDFGNPVVKYTDRPLTQQLGTKFARGKPVFTILRKKEGERGFGGEK